MRVRTDRQFKVAHSIPPWGTMPVLATTTAHRSLGLAGRYQVA